MIMGWRIFGSTTDCILQTLLVLFPATQTVNPLSHMSVGRHRVGSSKLHKNDTQYSQTDADFAHERQLLFEHHYTRQNDQNKV